VFVSSILVEIIWDWYWDKSYDLISGAKVWRLLSCIFLLYALAFILASCFRAIFFIEDWLAYLIFHFLASYQHIEIFILNRIKLKELVLSPIQGPQFSKRTNFLRWLQFTLKFYWSLSYLYYSLNDWSRLSKICLSVRFLSK
jgi:hypothetical protein